MSNLQTNSKIECQTNNQKYIRKLVPDDDSKKGKVQFYNKMYNFKKGQQVVLYFFNSTYHTTLMYMKSFINKCIMHPTNYYAFVTEESASDSLDKIRNTPGLFKYNVILDNNLLSQYIRSKTMPQVISFNKLGHFVGELHPQCLTVEHLLVNHEISCIVPFQDQYEKECLKPNNILYQMRIIHKQSLSKYSEILDKMVDYQNNIKQTTDLNQLIFQKSNVVSDIPQICLKSSKNQVQGVVYTNQFKQQKIQESKEVLKQFSQHNIQEQIDEKMKKYSYRALTGQQRIRMRQRMETNILATRSAVVNQICDDCLGKKEPVQKEAKIIKPEQFVLIIDEEVTHNIAHKIPRVCAVEVSAKVQVNELTGVCKYAYQSDLECINQYISNVKNYQKEGFTVDFVYNPKQRIKNQKTQNLNSK